VGSLSGADASQNVTEACKGHSEKLDKGEVLIAQFTEHTSAIKIRGNAKILTHLGEIESEIKK
jgi:hypothetical protein